MRQVTSRAGISDVRFRLVKSSREMREAGEEFGYPFIVKPADNQSSRGVRRVDGAEQCESLFADAQRFTRSDTILAEEFLPGIEITVEGFCLDGDYHTLGVSDKDHFPEKPEVARRLTYPARFDSELMERIRATNDAVVHELGLRNGVTHAEYMVQERDRTVRLVEIAARGGGSRIHSDIVPYLSGVDVGRAFIEFVTGGRPVVTPSDELRACNLEFFSFPSGIVKAIEGLEEAQALSGVHEILLEFVTGDALRRPEDDRSRPGFMVVFGKTRADVLDVSRRVTEMIRVITG
jgi:biotin carboxylase